MKTNAQSIELTKHQQWGFDELTKYATQHSKHPFFRFSGKAGTGKTFTIATFIRWFNNQFPAKKILVLAPSHKALKNLVKALESNALTLDREYEARTISSYLGKRPVMNCDTGKESFESDALTESLPPDLLIVDEYSMIQKSDVMEILSSVIDDETKLIFVGDLNQLPPIGEDKSCLFSLQSGKSQLNEIIRYSGELAVIADSYTESYTTEIHQQLPIRQSLKDETITQYRTKLGWIEEFIERVRVDIASGNTSGSRILCFTNKACEKWNFWVRADLWEDLKPYNVGDRLIATRPLFRPSKIDSSWQIAANNSSEFTVIRDCETHSISIYGVEYFYHVIPVITEMGLETNLYGIAKKSAQLRDDVINDYRNKKQWGKFYHLTNQFDSIAFNYAITVHKSQGSTFDSSFLDLADIAKDGSRQIMYTALTRSKEVHIF